MKSGRFLIGVVPISWARFEGDGCIGDDLVKMASSLFCGGMEVRWWFGGDAFVGLLRRGGFGGDSVEGRKNEYLKSMMWSV